MKEANKQLLIALKNYIQEHPEVRLLVTEEELRERLSLLRNRSNDRDKNSNNEES